MKLFALSIPLIAIAVAVGGSCNCDQGCAKIGWSRILGSLLRGRCWWRAVSCSVFGQRRRPVRRAATQLPG